MKILVANFKSAPLGIKFIVLYFILVPLAFLLPSPAMPDNIPSDILLSIRAFAIISGLVLCWLTAYLFLKKKDWMRKLVIVFAILGLLSSAFTALGLALGKTLAGMALFIFFLSLAADIFFVWYLTRQEARDFFRSKV